MSLPTAYLTSFRNTAAILEAIQLAQAPPRFTIRFLEGLGFSNSNDRAVVNVLKALGFLDDSGVPTQRYHRYLDQTQSALVLAEGLREAYEDLFRVNRQANNMSTGDVKNKMKTLSEGAFTDRVLSQMAGTFTALVKSADFGVAPEGGTSGGLSDNGAGETETSSRAHGNNGGDAGRGATDNEGGRAGGQAGGGSPFGSLAYNINIQLPESRDPAVYNAIFKALREHFR